MKVESPDKTVIDLRIEVTPANDDDHLSVAREMAYDLASSARHYDNDNKATVSVTVRVWQIIDNKVVVKLKEGESV